MMIISHIINHYYYKYPIGIIIPINGSPLIGFIIPIGTCNNNGKVYTHSLS